jgi:preprotein translocase subunit SecG
MVSSITDVNKIFFGDFFMVLILVDVMLLLFSLLHTNKFSAVIRNSGYIISTILIKISFGTDGILNTVLIVVAVLFGVLILAIHNKYEKIASLKPDIH